MLLPSIRSKPQRKPSRVIFIPKAFAFYLDHGKELDRHYIGSRYPNFYPAGAPYEYYTEEMAQRCLNYAGLILKEVMKYMPE